MKEPIFLIGYMAAGKTSVGKLLGETIQRGFIDTDKLIEQKENLTVDVIFEEYGDTYFRDIEADIVLNYDFEDKVVSTGGGLPCFNGNIGKLLVQGTTIYLQASVKTITNRLLQTDISKRPLLKNVAMEELSNNITLKLKERNFYYKQAHYTVETDGKSERDIVNEIVALLLS
jgi:shikimate kinase